MNDFWELLETLCGLDAPSGCEDAVRSFIREQAAPFADETAEDPMGNLMVLRRGTAALEKPLMLCAHMDEVGVIVKRITDEGMVKFGFVGGVDPRVAIGRRVRFTNGVRGVVGIKAVHLTTSAERKTMPKTKDLYIDIGAGSRAQAEARLSPGDYGTFDVENRRFGDGLFKAKALDDRVGCAVLLTLLRGQPAVDTWFCFTVQEEVGLRGAATAAFRADPGLCLIVEGTTAADLAEAPAHKQYAGCAAGRCSRSWTGARSTTASCSACCAARRKGWGSNGRPSTWLPEAPTRGVSTRCARACGRRGSPYRCGISIRL